MNDLLERPNESRWVRWGGLLAVVSSAILALALVARHTIFLDFMVREAMRFPYMVLHMIMLAAVIGLLVALIAFFAHQAHRMGRPGLASFVVMLAGWLLLVGVFWFLAFGVPTVARLEPRSSILARDPFATAEAISLGLAGIGLLLFGLASWRARVFPRWAIALLLVGDLVWGLWSATNPFGFPIGYLALLTGLSAMGVTLWLADPTSAARAVPTPLTVALEGGDA